jgi:hypothetical protein
MGRDHGINSFKMKILLDQDQKEVFMKTKMTLIWTLALLILLNLCHSRLSFAADTQTTVEEKKIQMDIGFNQEDRDVGLKRMEIIDKALSPELIEKKRAMVHTIEQDYDDKISRLLQSITTPIGRNTVITHLDVNFFDTEFESQVRASQNASVSIILGRDGFDKWAAGQNSEQEALEQIKGMIRSTFKIPEESISVTVAPN